MIVPVAPDHLLILHFSIQNLTLFKTSLFIFMLELRILWHSLGVDFRANVNQIFFCV